MDEGRSLGDGGALAVGAVGLGGEERLVVVGAVGDGAAVVANDQDLAQRRDAPADLLEQLPQGAIHDDRGVAGVGRDVGDIVGVEPQVEGVHGAAHGRDAEVALEVLGVVPAQGADPIALADAEAPERAGEPLGAGVGIGVGLAADRLVGAAAHDLDVGVEGAAALEQMGQSEGHVHHGVTFLARTSAFASRSRVISRQASRSSGEPFHRVK